MEKAKVNGVELEYEVQGAGEPVLLIGSYLPALSAWPFGPEQAATMASVGASSPRATARDWCSHQYPVADDRRPVSRRTRPRRVRAPPPRR
jgi:hypothetical protein